MSAVFLQDNLFDMLQTQQAELETRLMDENIDIVSVHIKNLLSFILTLFTQDTDLEFELPAKSISDYTLNEAQKILSIFRRSEKSDQDFTMIIYETYL